MTTVEPALVDRKRTADTLNSDTNNDGAGAREEDAIAAKKARTDVCRWCGAARSANKRRLITHVHSADGPDVVFIGVFDCCTPRGHGVLHMPDGSRVESTHWRVDDAGLHPRKAGIVTLADGTVIRCEWVRGRVSIPEVISVTMPSGIGGKRLYTRRRSIVEVGVLAPSQGGTTATAWRQRLPASHGSLAEAIALMVGTDALRFQVSVDNRESISVDFLS